MNPAFYRLHTDRTRTVVPLEGMFGGARASACWLIGGGPSLERLPYEAIRDSCIPRMCINLAGARLMRPTFWTSYDPSVRFHRSVYLDPGVMKFLHRRRAMDLVPETTFKVCDCPNTYFFERDAERGFAEFLAPMNGGIVDWADSMVQAIDILYRLGFRVIYLAGCEMRVRPSREQVRRAAEAGVRYRANELLIEFVRRCRAAGVSAEELDALPAGRQYHFGEQKPIAAAAQTDLHYFRVAQYLRLSRRAMSLAGVQLVSVTPHSRLNDYFEYQPARTVLERIRREIGEPASEPLVGLYRQTGTRIPHGLGPMRDYVRGGGRRVEGGGPEGGGGLKAEGGGSEKRLRNRSEASGGCKPPENCSLLIETEGLERVSVPHDNSLVARLRALRLDPGDVCEEG